MFFQLSIQKRDARMLANRLYLQVKLNWEPLLKNIVKLYYSKNISRYYFIGNFFGLDGEIF